ncbi:MAG: hypothetical protein GF411_15900 [Candidatus Lokiarchaeota archaeon]|nr:hypothetical protein [Candidatus Lokiarchaeota archaeon]
MGVEVSYEGRSLGALYFAFGISIGSSILRYGGFDFLVSEFGPFQVDQLILFVLFLGSFIGSIFYNVRIDIFIDILLRKLVYRKFKGIDGKEHRQDIAYIDILCHRWDLGIWDSVENDFELAIRSAFSSQPIRGNVSNIKSGFFSGISLSIALAGFLGLVPEWILFFMGLTGIIVFLVPIALYWKPEVVITLSKLKWAKEAMTILEQREDMHNRIDIGISYVKITKMIEQLEGNMELSEYDTFLRNSEIPLKIIRTKGNESGVRYIDSVLGKLLYQCTVDQLSDLDVRSQSDFQHIFSKLIDLFSLTDLIGCSSINWTGIDPIDKKSSYFFKHIPLCLFTGTHVVESNLIPDSIELLLNKSTSADQTEYIHSMMQTTIDYEKRMGKNCNFPVSLINLIFHILAKDSIVLSKIRLDLFARIVKGGIADASIETISLDILHRILEFLEKPHLVEYVHPAVIESVLVRVFGKHKNCSSIVAELKQHLTLYAYYSMNELITKLVS